MTQPSRAITYFLESAIISSPRLNGELFDITGIIAEINIYESLSIPYISGDLLMVDSSQMASLIRFNGQETLTLRLYVEEDFQIEKEFIIYSVRRQEKAENDNVSIYILSIIEKHGFYSNFVRLNRAYDGNIADIIYNIYDNVLFDDIDREFLNQDNFEQTFQSIKFTSNNRTPLDVCMWLTQRATTDIGEPFFLYSSLRDGPQFRSLASLLTQEVNNLNNPYRYSQVQSSEDLIDEIYQIYELNIPENDNSINLAKSGALGMTYISIDPFNKVYNLNEYQGEFNVEDHFNRKRDAATTLNQFTIYDNEFTIGPDDTPLHELESQIYSQVNTSLMHGEIKSYDEEPEISDHLKKVSRRSDIALLNKQKYSITVPGYTLLNTGENTSIGQIINVMVPVDQPLLQAVDENELHDPKRSGPTGGLFLTTKVRHRFGMDSDYYAAMEIARTDANTQL